MGTQADADITGRGVGFLFFSVLPDCEGIWPHCQQKEHVTASRYRAPAQKRNPDEFLEVHTTGATLRVTFSLWFWFFKKYAYSLGQEFKWVLSVS